MDYLASFVEYYLPVFIPLFLTVISVLAGVLTKRIQMTVSDLLKIHTDLVLGLFSFVIWALVTYQQTGRIDLNSDFQISLIRVVLLLFGNLVLLVAGFIVLNVKWEQWAVGRDRFAYRRLENAGNGAFLMVTFVGVFAPIGLANERPKPPDAPVAIAKPQGFIVAVPYLDLSLRKQVGVGNWGDRMLCEVKPVSALTIEEAVSASLKGLEDSGKTQPMFAFKPPLSVSVARDRIVAMSTASGVAAQQGAGPVGVR